MLPECEARPKTAANQISIHQTAFPSTIRCCFTPPTGIGKEYEALRVSWGEDVSTPMTERKGVRVWMSKLEACVLGGR